MAIHLRGTSYKTSANHPFPLTVNQTLNLIGDLIKKHNYTKLFLCTEDLFYFNLINDLKQEMPLYKDISNAYNILKKLKLKKNTNFYLENLYKSYNILIDKKIFAKKELYYLKAWIKDIQKFHN